MKPPRISGSTSDFLPDLRLGFENLRAHTLRSLLTMLGMIFGVAAVVAMLSIGAGAQQEVMAFIEQLGVRNLIVEAREAPDSQTLQRIRKLSAGLNFQDYRMIHANLEGITASTARKRFTPAKLVPKPLADAPVVYGVSPGTRRSRTCRSSTAASSTRKKPPRPHRWRCSARVPRHRCSASTIRSGST
jgi:putative ABC transport system permease protein